MIITIQSINKRFVISQVTEITSFNSLNDATRYADKVSNFVHNLKGERPTIKILPIIRPIMATKKKINIKNNPYEFGFMKGYKAGRESYRIQMQLEDVTNYNQPMAMKSRTYPAKKKAVAKKKVVAKGKKK